MARKPQIVLSSLDVDRIEALIAAMPASVFPGKMELQAELDRADVVAPAVAVARWLGEPWWQCGHSCAGYCIRFL